jgi:hypothetical protein
MMTDAGCQVMAIDHMTFGPYGRFKHILHIRSSCIFSMMTDAGCQVMAIDHMTFGPYGRFKHILHTLN